MVKEWLVGVEVIVVFVGGSGGREVGGGCQRFLPLVQEGPVPSRGGR